MAKMVYIAKPCHSYSLSSDNVFINKKSLEHLLFHSFHETQQVGNAEGQGYCLCVFEPSPFVS
jgi:hypothetical protein